MYHKSINTQPIALPIKELLGVGINSANYEIQVYQRNYAWRDQEVYQLIDDISDNVDSNKDYYLGNLIIYPRHLDSGEKIYETIDGQQRLTTLTLLACALKHKFNCSAFDSYNRVNIRFAHRSASNESLEYIISNGKSGDEPSDHIFSIYKAITTYLKSKKISIELFCQYLCERVKIIRIALPTDTSLNHYFEIMNSRGEQLEQHEVLKAMMMGKLDPTEHSLFAKIWDACSDMNHYVQMNFSKSNREVIFGGSWDGLPIADFDTLQSEIKDEKESETSESRSLLQLFNDDTKNQTFEDVANNIDTNDGQIERFNSVIDFSGFLLHVLKVVLGRGSDVRLDDKNLLSQFRALNYDDTKKLDVNFVKDFAMSLLRIRYLFDRYILKREYINSEERWSLKHLDCYDDTKRKSKKPSYIDLYSDRNCVMLQSMFHVSSPAYNYKQWLSGALFCLVENCEEDSLSNTLEKYLQNLACSYMLDRYLQPTESKVQLVTIVHNEYGVAKRSVDSASFDEINEGTLVENFVFNFYDYVIWQENRSEFRDFTFAYRTSVEHFYPQMPQDGFKCLEDNGNDGNLHNFGNLCIMSRSDNSKFSNNMPKAKVGNFYQSSKGGKQSLKLIEMMELETKYDKWDETEIKETYKIAEIRLKSYLNLSVENNINRGL